MEVKFEEWQWEEELTVFTLEHVGLGNEFLDKYDEELVTLSSSRSGPCRSNSGLHEVPHRSHSRLELCKVIGKTHQNLNSNV